MMYAERVRPMSASQEKPQESSLSPLADVAVGPVRPLAYTAGPVQRRTDSGISDAENAAVRRLSSGKVDLHAMGATATTVAPGDPRLSAVNARSFTRGTHALIGNPADRGHELWHMAQQAMGRIPVTGHIGGQPVNSDPGLEREADRMGETVQRSGGNAIEPITAWGSQAGCDTGSPIQRRVKSFKAKAPTSQISPGGYLWNNLDRDAFTNANSTINESIKNNMTSIDTNSRKVVEHISASIAPDKKNAYAVAKNYYFATMMGRFGSDNFFLDSKVHESFEGGHIISHSLWEKNDPNVSLCDDFDNLVPMSRTMNVGPWNTWKSQENLISKQIDKGKKLKLKVDIERPKTKTYTYDSIAYLLNLNLDEDYSGDTIDIPNWLPAKITPTVKGEGPKLSVVTENELHNTFGQITSTPELVAAIKSSPLWSRCTEEMRQKITEIDSAAIDEEDEDDGGDIEDEDDGMGG